MSDDRSYTHCAHAERIGGELLCNLSAALYECADERSMPWFTAVLFKACGRGGRFYVPAGETPQEPVAFDH